MFRLPASEGDMIIRKGQEERKYHKYYQWVCFTLFFQALCFYIPRYRQSVDTLGSENSIIFQVSVENVGGWKTKHVGARYKPFLFSL